MRVLLIKTSSMGDIIHCLPALTDAGKMLPQVKFDWLVEEPFADIPVWHSQVDRIIPVALRRWRKSIFSKDTQEQFKQLRERLRERSYDVILDAQGLVKSAWLTLLAKGTRAGLDWHSAREAPASLFYQKKCKVNFYQHAIVRMRSLFSQALEYQLPSNPPDFGVDSKQFVNTNEEKYIVFLHGTTWVTKEWPETYWLELADKISQLGYRIKISGGSEQEVARAYRIAEHNRAVDVMPRLAISRMAELLSQAKAAVAVDTGLGHLSAALNVPTISIYGATNPEYTGALGNYSLQLAANFPCAPCLSRQCHYKKASNVSPACYAAITPEKIIASLKGLLA